MINDDKHFNVSQSSKLADYLKKFDSTTTNSIKKSSISINKKRKIENDKTPFNKSFKSTTDQKIKSIDIQDRSDKLRNLCIEKLMSSQFRNINQYLYENPTVQAIRYMTPELFKKYHEIYSQIVEKWPVKPLDIIINEIKKLPSFNRQCLTIADMGCGQARLAEHFKEIESNTIVHSFDLFNLNDFITKASMDNVPLEDNKCDIVVYCLSLMSTNLRDCLIEGNRIMKKNGLLYIAEVTSRFEDIKFKVFISSVEQYGFKLIKETKLQPDNYFILFKFKKISNIEKLKGLPGITLKSCKYKTR